VKADILYDAADGRVISILYHSPAEGQTRGPVAFLRPQDGQQVATLDIPPEFQHLGRARLHHAIRIDVRGESARIVAVT
jgi:hypothetical protein